MMLQYIYIYIRYLEIRPPSRSKLQNDPTLGSQPVTLEAACDGGSQRGSRTEEPGSELTINHDQASVRHDVCLVQPLALEKEH